MTSLTERLTGERTGQVMEYEEELVHNAPTAARNAVMSMAKKVEDNVLCVMTTPVVMLPSTAPNTPEANPPGILPKAPNVLVISRYACLQGGSRWPSRALSRPKPRSNHDINHTSPSALLLGKSRGVTSPRARPLRAF